MTKLKAQTQWFHITKSMIDSGDLANLSGSAVKIYLVVKSHVNYSTGLAFPSIETIARKSGLSVSQVNRELKALVKFGYLVKRKKGRNNLYRIREKIEITDMDDKPSAISTWDYVPSGVRDAIIELKNILGNGDSSGAKLIQVNWVKPRQQHVSDNTEDMDMQKLIAEDAGISGEMGEKLLACWEASRKRKKEKALI